MALLAQYQTAVSEPVRRALSWWLGELAGMVPQRFNARPENAPAVLEISNGQSTLVLASRGNAQPMSLPLEGADAQEIRKLVQSAMRRRTSQAVIIRLEQSEIFEAQVTLPLNAERTLRPILQNQLERLVPLPADQVEFDYQITARSPAARTLSVKLIVATRMTIERALALAQSLGLNPRSVIAFSGGSEPATLWRAGRGEGASRQLRWLRRGLEATAVVLFVAAYGAYVYRLGVLQDELQLDVAQATKASAVARDLMNRDAQVANAVALLQRRQREIDPLMLLSELTKLVPTTSWVSQLSVRGRNVELIGYAPRVADLISRIENHDLFYDPKFRSPITMSPDGKGERFDVSFDVFIADSK